MLEVLFQWVGWIKGDGDFQPRMVLWQVGIVVCVWVLLGNCMKGWGHE